MAIIYKQGNVVDALINGDVDYIAHCCNAQGVMGSGVAKEIKERVPEAYLAYRRSEMSLGDVSCDGGVYNLIAQLNYGYDGKRYVNYGALAACFVRMRMDLWVNDTIGIPYKMASDRAGGDWDVVLELIEHLVVPYVKDVVIYKL